jgi:hypothetical protein
MQHHAICLLKAQMWRWKGDQEKHNQNADENEMKGKYE